jgi:hypothetical protein
LTFVTVKDVLCACHHAPRCTCFDARPGLISTYNLIFTQIQTLLEQTVKGVLFLATCLRGGSRCSRSFRVVSVAVRHQPVRHQGGHGGPERLVCISPCPHAWSRGGRGRGDRRRGRSRQPQICGDVLHMTHIRTPTAVSHLRGNKSAGGATQLGVGGFGFRV